jgi:signal transduction histidine kinase
MIELAKLQANQMPFEITDLEVGIEMSAVEEDLQTIIGRLKKSDLEIRILHDTKASKIIFSADPDRFKQLMICLAENAVKFTDQGYIEIGCKRSDEQKILFWVKDTGIGIHSSDLVNIFDWFRKSQLAIDKIYQGTGLGLTIAKLIVETMDGQIWVESEAGKGSCFYFTLPTALPESVKLVPDKQYSRIGRRPGQSTQAG